MRRCAPESAAAAALLALVLLQFLPVWLRGLTPFWGDLTYIHHPWQAFAAQCMQAGRLPLWDPNLYLGMPSAARMQSSAFYPGEVPLFLFPFAGGLALFQLVHYWLAGWLMFLWLRSLRLGVWACLGGAIVFTLGGGLASRMPFINHLSSLSLMPALLLFFRRPLLLALALSCAFMAGYPPFLVGSTAAAWALTALVLEERPLKSLCAHARVWAAAGVASMLLCAAQLIPGAELMAQSRRSGGLDLAETLSFSYTAADLLQWVSPILLPWSAFDPAVDWWKCAYVGFGGILLCLAGLRALPRRRAWGAAALLAFFVLLFLGRNTALSRLLWTYFTPLRYVRYPGNLSYLALPSLSLLAAAGLQSLPAARRPLIAAFCAFELCVYGAGAAPLAPRGLFASAGPLVRSLQESLKDTRYLISPLALESHNGAGPFDWKHRLYGLTNDPYRLRAAANFGEPLVPRANYDFMDLLYRMPSAEAAARVMPWAGVSRLITPQPVQTKLLESEGRNLWEVSRVKSPVALAYWLGEEAGAALPAGLPQGELPELGEPLARSGTREDRFEVSGIAEAPGWAYVAEPRYPGWNVTLETPLGAGSVRPEPALLAFQKIHVPQGPFLLRFRFDPASWRHGRFITLLSLMALACFCYHRRLRAHEA